VSPAIDSINVTFAELQTNSLLISQQEALLQKLLRTVIKMFGIEIIQRGDVGDSDDGEDDAYLQHCSLRVRALAIVNHIDNQGSFPRDCYQRLVEADQHQVVKDIAKYAMTLVTGLKSVKSGRYAANHAMEKDEPPKLPAQLVKLRHGLFLNAVLDPSREHV
jgi:hypothetical protein